MTITLHGDDVLVEQAAKQLYRLIDVLKVQDVTGDPTVEHEIALIKSGPTSATAVSADNCRDATRPGRGSGRRFAHRRGDRKEAEVDALIASRRFWHKELVRPVPCIPGVPGHRGRQSSDDRKMYYDATRSQGLAGQKIAIIGSAARAMPMPRTCTTPATTSLWSRPTRRPRALAEEAGLKTADIADAVKAADVDHDPRPGHHPEEGV